MKPRLGQKGFSLVELAITISLIGIIAALAVPNYLNFQKRAKQAEVRSNLGAARTCLTSYFAESSTYNIGNEGTLAFDDADNQGTPFGSSLSARGAKKPWSTSSLFSVIGFDAQSAVYFNYSMTTNATAYTVMASGDIDKNGLTAHFYLFDQSTVLSHAGDTY